MWTTSHAPLPTATESAVVVVVVVVAAIAAVVAAGFAAAVGGDTAAAPAVAVAAAMTAPTATAPVVNVAAEPPGAPSPAALRDSNYLAVMCPRMQMPVAGMALEPDRFGCLRKRKSPSGWSLRTRRHTSGRRNRWFPTLFVTGPGASFGRFLAHPRLVRRADFRPRRSGRVC